MSDGPRLRTLVVVGNPKRESRTRTVGEAVAAAVGAWLRSEGASVEQETLEVVDLAGPGLFAWGDEAVGAAVARAQAADLLIVATPTYKASYTGLLKAYLDNVPTKGLSGRVAVPLMMGAADMHFLAPDAFLRPVLLELGATCPTPGLFVLESELDDLDAVIGPWLEASRAGLQALLAERPAAPTG